MKIKISSKNEPMSEKLSNYIEKKLDKIGKYFDEDTTANIVVSKLRETPKFEATINAKQAVLRAEMANDSIYDAVDLVTDKLEYQMSKLKGKLESRYKENKALKLEFVPEPEEEDGTVQAGGRPTAPAACRYPLRGRMHLAGNAQEPAARGTGTASGCRGPSGGFHGRPPAAEIHGDAGKYASFGSGRGLWEAVLLHRES